MELQNPEIVEAATDRALRGDDLHSDGRFERDREREIVVPGR